MTNYESTSYFVEDKAGESVAFTVLPPSEGQATAGTGEHDPVLKLWSTQVMPDNRVINVEVGFSRDDVGGLQSYLNDQFGRGKATAGSPTPQTQRDNDNAEYFKSGWMSALKEIVLLARNDRNPIDWAVAQIEGQVVGDEAPMSAPVPMSDMEPGEPYAADPTMPQDVETFGLDYVGPHTPYDPTAVGVPVQPNYTPGPEVYAQRQCPAISNGQQCTRPENHGNTDGLTHYFPGQGLQIEGQPMHPQTGDGAATPPAAPTLTPIAPGGEQAAVSAPGVGSTGAAPSSAPAEKKRTRRTKLEMAYDRALEALQAIPQGGADWDAATHAMNEAKQALQDKDPGNSRLSQVIVNQQPLGNVQVANTPPEPEQPTVQFAGEPVNPFTQPAPVQPQYAAFAGQPVGQVPQGQEYQPLVSPEESQAAAAFPCPAVHSDGVRRCVRPYGHELQTANNPEPKPHAFATDPSTLQTPQPTQPGPVAPFLPAPPMQPAAFSVTTPALTGMTDGGAQILSFQTPPTPADPTAFQVQGANLQPPAPAAPFLQPTPNGGQ